MQITRPFLIGQTEVTVSEWQQVMGSTPGDVDQEDLPVTSVSWKDAEAFCETLSEGTTPSGSSHRIHGVSTTFEATSTNGFPIGKRTRGSRSPSTPMESSSIRRDRITHRLESGWFDVAANSTIRMRSRPRSNRPIDRTTSASGSWLWLTRNPPDRMQPRWRPQAIRRVNELPHNTHAVKPLSQSS